MMQVRCQRCGWNYTLSRDSIGYAVAETEASHSEYYQEDCPKCRNVIKIQLKDLRRRLPDDYVLPPLPPRPTPIHVVKKDEEPKAAAPVQEAVSVTQSMPKQVAVPKDKPAPKPKARPKAKAAPRPKTKAKSKPKAKSAPKKK
jgi:phage FluMu protein Com